MKRSYLGVMAIVAACLAQGAQAEQHGAAYATIKAIVDYCVRVDVQHRNAYETMEAPLLASIAVAGDSGDYEAAYAATSEALMKLPEGPSRAKCAAGIGAPSTGRHDDDHDKDR